MCGANRRLLSAGYRIVMKVTVPNLPVSDSFVVI